MQNSIITSDMKSDNLTKKMSLEEMASALSCSYETIKRTARKLGFTKNGVKTYLDESQATILIDELKKHNNRSDLPSTTVVSGASTSLTPALRIKQAMEMMQSAYEEELQILRAKQIEDAPKVEFFNQVTDSTSCIDMSECAKVLNFKNYGRNRLFELLREKSILRDNNQPYQKYIDAGYFRVIESKFILPTGEVRINLKTIVFQKGVDFIRKLILADIKSNLSNPDYMEHAIENSAEEIIKENNW